MADKLTQIAADFERASQPVWLWDAASARILWANRAGLAFWLSETVFDLAARSFDPDGPDARAMADAGANIAARLSPSGGTIRARLDIARAELSAVPRGRLVRIAGFDKGAHELSSTLRAGEEASLDDVRGDNVAVERALELLLSNCIRASSDSAEMAVETPSETPTESSSEVSGRVVGENLAKAGLAARLAESERKSQAKSDFIAKLSHEMRTPLNAIIGFSEILQQGHFGPLGDTRYESYAGDIRLSAEHLLSLVNDLLDLARIEAGKLDLEFGGVALQSLIDESVRLVKPQAARYGVELEIMVRANLPLVVADARSLKQVLINLLSNAVNFTGQGGMVRVTVESNAEGGITVHVIDTGVGMSDGEVQLALAPFGRIDSAVQKNRKGTGLGLPVAKALAEANKAEFHIESTPHRGTRVALTFPPSRVLAD